MKKFNVKVLSMAVAAAVASGAAGAAEQNFAAAVGGKDDQGQAAFFTVFGEGTTYDKGTGKLTFKKDSDALLLKTLELEQTINGFAAGSNFITTDANGNKTVREATNEDIAADSLKGVGLAGGLTAVNARVDNLAEETAATAAALDDQDETIEQLKTAITTNGTRIAEVATGVNDLNKSVADMGKEISTKFDEVDSEISKASSELSESIEKVSEDVTAVNTRVDSLAQDTADAKAAAKAAEDKVTELSANVDSKVKEAKDAADKAVDAASKIDAVADKADKASKGVEDLAKELEATQKATAQVALATMENSQEFNGFKEGDQIVVTKNDGSKVIRTATKKDVENDDLDGLGLKEVVAQHDASLYDLTDTVNENSEALVKTAEVVNAISADVNANKAALEEQKEANEGFNNAIASLDKDIGDLASAGKAAMEALEVNRQDIDANKAAIETKADKADFEELAKYTANMGKKVNDIGDEVTALSDATSAAITRQDKDIVDLAKGLQLAAEAVEDNRKEIDANKAAIETKADKADFEELAKYTANMGKKVNDIGDEVTALSDATSAAITRQDKDIVDLAKGLQLAAEAVEDNRKEIDANKAAIETKADKADFEELAKYTANMGKKVNDIGDEVTSLSDATTTAVARIDEDIVSLKKAGLTAANALEANRQDIDANKAAIAENTAKLEEQKEANEGFNNAITSLDEDIITLQKADLAAADALEARRTEIAANKAAIETKADKTAVERVETIAAKAQKTAQEVQGAVEVADSHAKAAQTAAAKAQESADINAVQIVANTKQIDTNKTDIATLQTASNQHATGIAKNSARIDSLDKNVANLRKETRQGLAAQAALSGLFQPYSVGKFNVTAALGGFKSDTAVAVGAGYRFNENFAAKAGLAVGTSSGGSASYNVGLNYEW